MDKIKAFFTKLWGLTIVKRTVHTFWQAFLAVFVVGIPLVTQALGSGGLQSGEKALIALGTAAAAAGLAALKTMFVNYKNYKSTRLVK